MVSHLSRCRSPRAAVLSSHGWISHADPGLRRITFQYTIPILTNS
jgi:hypothetical protein